MDCFGIAPNNCGRCFVAEFVLLNVSHKCGEALNNCNAG